MSCLIRRAFAVSGDAADWASAEAGARAQVAVAAMRGPAGLLFARGGTSTSPEFFAPDQQVVLDVTPRNLGAAP